MDKCGAGGAQAIRWSNTVSRRAPSAWGSCSAKVYKWYLGNSPLGTYKFIWKKGGHKIDKDAMDLRSEGV
jgi:hypothetical protein